MGEFFSWLITLESWQGIIIFITVFSGFGLFIYFVVRKGFLLKYRSGEINVGRNKQENFSPHRNCKHSKDIVILLNDVNKFQYEKFHLQEIDMLKEQMKYAEQKIDYIRSALQKQYLHLLHEKGVENLTSNKSFLCYKNVLKSIQGEIIDIVRGTFKENHFDELNDEAFDVYSKNKFEFLSNETTDYLNILYVCQDDINREELYTENKKIVLELKIAVIDIFQSARRISIDNKVKVMELDERIERLIGRYI